MRNLILKAKGLALAGVAGLMLATGGIAVSTSPAEAGARTGTWKYYNPGYRGGYRGAYGGYRGGYGYRPHYGYRRGYNRGGAVAAGVATGLALGALGAAAAAPAYGYYGGAPACYWTRQRGWDAWGNPVVTRVQVCD
jgi:hypothetical protein